MYNKTSRQNLNCVLELPTITTNWSKKKNKNYSSQYIKILYLDIWAFFSTGTAQNTTTIAIIIIIINFVHWFLNTNIIIDYRLSTSFNNRISLSIANVFSSSYKSTSIMEWKVTFHNTNTHTQNEFQSINIHRMWTLFSNSNFSSSSSSIILIIESLSTYIDFDF